METHEVWVLRLAGGVVRLWCNACQSEVDMIALETTGMGADLTGSSLHSGMNSTELHVQGGDGLLLVCLNSLLRSVPQHRQSHNW